MHNFTRFCAIAAAAAIAGCAAPQQTPQIPAPPPLPPAPLAANPLDHDQPSYLRLPGLPDGTPVRNITPNPAPDGLRHDRVPVPGSASPAGGSAPKSATMKKTELDFTAKNAKNAENAKATATGDSLLQSK